MTDTLNTIAPLQNVSLITAGLDKVVHRPIHLPGLITAYGPSGYGKTWAATFAANKFSAYYVEAKSYWTKKAFALAVLQEMGIAPANTVYEMIEQISEQLTLSRRPLIIDEFDHIIDRKLVELVRDIYEGSQASILIIGEERIPVKLKKYERFHGRVINWIPAQPPDIEDAKHLRNLYCKDIEISDDLLKHIHSKSNASARRIVVNLEMVKEHALARGWQFVDLKNWGDNKLFTGRTPPRRV